MPKNLTRDRFEHARIDLLDALIEYRGEMLMEATVAGCALIAQADGTVVPAEIQRMLGLMRADPLLSMFPRDQVTAEFDSVVRSLAEDSDQARGQAFRRLAALAPQPRLARFVLQACISVSKADDVVHPREVEQVRAIRIALGLAEESGPPPLPSRRSRTALMHASVQGTVQ